MASLSLPPRVTGDQRRPAYINTAKRKKDKGRERESLLSLHSLWPLSSHLSTSFTPHSSLLTHAPSTTPAITTSTCLSTPHTLSPRLTRPKIINHASRPTPETPQVFSPRKALHPAPP
ncbi:hypothetical protein EJ06DRAFT_530783 [Trichodelitschia bisporula]|uniref:Uncharacterized protein n=1 Tax=Trichodelitschia bisporula TaxID=703511 RepID=A0A6G1HW14_9PEZI|nr:hypothetical protein EJ06DRAFT_530783 [Trichodelitschia bisporula]